MSREREMFDRLLELFERHKYGVIGTLAVHTTILFAVAIIRISGVPEENERSEMVIEMLPEEEAETLMAQHPVEARGPDQHVTNVANDLNATSADHPLDSRTSQRLDEKVMEEVKDLERNEFDRLAEERKANGEEIDLPELDPSKWDKKRYMAKSDRPVKVEGPTTVSYDLPGRHHESLYIPAYLCQGSGRVVVRITVDRMGAVRDTQVDEKASNANSCMMSFASEAAAKARFDRPATAPNEQKGTITFEFLPQ
ncbi:MAG: energy transducer TonB [Flavobacteriales bacterium]|nr:energy transducer TonB [Flavobacteriales bacterium]MCB9193658.1 energy transducer TonB [Flavobacteriales bacterium]